MPATAKNEQLCEDALTVISGSVSVLKKARKAPNADEEIPKQIQYTIKTLQNLLNNA